MQLEARLAQMRVRAPQQHGQRLLGNAQFGFSLVAEVADGYGHIAFRKRGDGVAAGIGAAVLVSGAILQMELQRALCRVGNDDGLFGEGQPRGFLAAGLRQKEAAPARAGGVDVLNVEHHAGEVLVEDARLNLERGLPRRELAFDGVKSRQRHGAEHQRHQ